MLGPIAPDQCTLHIGILPYVEARDWLLLGVYVSLPVCLMVGLLSLAVLCWGASRRGR
jgi:hypothetical protein